MREDLLSRPSVVQYGRCIQENAASPGLPAAMRRNFAMNAIVTVVGQDKVGIIAAVCALLAEHNVNILDISQTILQGSFTMVMAVDVGAAKVSVGELRDLLEQLGQKMEISIRIQREEIFDAMHRI